MKAESTYKGIADSIINLLESLRDALTDVERLILVGQLTAWIQDTSSTSARRKLASLSTPNGQLSGAELQRVAREISQDLTEPPFYSAFFGEVPLRYERIDSHKLRTLVLELQHAVLVVPEELANSLVRWWSDLAGVAPAQSPPPEIASTMLQLADAPNGEPVYCVGAAAESVAIECLRQSRIPLVVSPQLPRMALLYAQIRRVEISVFPHDPLSYPAAEFFHTHGRKTTLAVPPFGMKVTDFDARGWRHSNLELRTYEALVIECISQLAASRAVIMVPNGVLFRVGSEQRLRQHLVDRGHLQSIISFPPGLLSSTSMPFSLLVLDTTQTSSPQILVCDIDAKEHIKTAPGMLKHRRRQFTGEHELVEAVRKHSATLAREISRTEIKAHNYNLNVNRFLAASVEARSGDSHAKMPLDTVVAIFKPQAFRSVEKGAGITIGEVSPGELPLFDFLTTAPRQRSIDPEDRHRFAQQQLLANDVLLSTKGTIGRSGIARPDEAAGEIFPSQSMLILRLNPKGPIQDPIVLLMYLRSPYFQALLRSLVVGSTIPNVSLTDLRRLPIRIPTPTEQNKLRHAFDTQRGLQQQIDAFRQQQELIESSVWNTTQLTLQEADQ